MHPMPGLIRGAVVEAETMDDVLLRAGEIGQSANVWHDGFETPNALRNQNGEPNVLWSRLFGTPWPVEHGGGLVSFGRVGMDWHLNWRVRRSPSVFKVHVGQMQPPFVVNVESEPQADLVSAYDPESRVLSIFVDGLEGEHALVVSGMWSEDAEME